MNYTQKINGSFDQFLYDDSCDNAMSFLLEPENFRPFSDGLTELLCKYNFVGNKDSVEEKCSYLFDKLQKNGSTISKKTVKSWFVGDHRPGLTQDSRRKMYEICFALGVSLPDVYWFFNHVYLDRCFNCHVVSEAVFCYCLNNGINYTRACEIIDSIDGAEVASSEQNNIMMNYTKFIKNQIMNFKTEEELIIFLVSQKDNYNIWNTSAIKQITSFYNVIIGDSDTRNIVSSLKEEIDRKVKSQNNEKKKNTIDTLEIDKCGLLIRELIWDAYHCAGSETVCDYLNEELRGKSLSNAFLLKQLAINPIESFNYVDKNEFTELICKNFPSSKTLSNILDDKKASLSTSYDSIRKILILFHFYKFWCYVKIEHPDTLHYPPAELYEIYLDEINICLGDAGYEDLFAGNPYDWIFLCASRDKEPLAAFREFMDGLMVFDDEDLKL